VELGRQIDATAKWPDLVDRLRADLSGAGDWCRPTAGDGAGARFVETEKLVAIRAARST